VYTLLGRFLLRVFLALAAISVATYAGDSAVFLLRGSPQSKVTVGRYMGIPLKGNKEEFDYLGSVQAPCVVALFPHRGVDPCWYLHRDPNQWENL
jgi:hypothetical protein